MAVSNCENISYAYDVFINFRGVDTKSTFIHSLSKAFSLSKITTFIHDDNLRKQDDELVKVIQSSRIWVVVLSKNYAESSFCLDELVHIVNFFQEHPRRFVLPVFYHVDPSELRYEDGVYGKALALHQKRLDCDSQRVLKWRNALRQVAEISTAFNFKLGDGCYEYEELIDKIVSKVSTTIGNQPLVVSDHLVGINYRVKDLEWYIEEEKRKSSYGHFIFGIYGFGGIGKTTLAQALYSSISPQFEATCFLDDVGGKSRKHGLIYLQEILLAHTVGEKGLMPVTVSEGFQFLKDRLSRKKVLVVLDNVDSVDQLQATVGRGYGDCPFGFGSIIIITTRDKYLLASRGIEREYKLDGLPNDEALELLSWNAFKTDKVHIKFIDSLYRAITCASGMPLALEVIGSNLFSKGLQEWNSTLNSYEQIPHMDIKMILKVSYDALSEQEKQIFLDIACFFKDYEITEVECILGAHYDLCLKPHISTLVQKSLIKIDKHGSVTMHDLICDMGIEIVRQESLDDPGKRSRLWSTEDIVQVLQQNTGTNDIQMIIMDSPKHEEVVQWDGKSFENMNNLRTLILRNTYFSEGPKHLPNRLRVLEWWGYPSRSLPPDFYPKKLDILKLPNSCFSLQSFSPQKFVNMEILNLNKCEFIINIPDVFGVLKNLKEISFSYCENLVSIHASYVCMSKLRSLNLGGCSRLQIIPPFNLPSLEFLNLSYCSTLANFPEILVNMENIIHLSLEYTAIRELPYSIVNLSRLESLEIHGCGILQLPSIIAKLPRLKELRISQCEGLESSKENKKVGNVSSNVFSYSYMKHIDFLSCNISDEFIEKGLTWFTNVIELDLSMNNFTVLPACIQECHFLTKLRLDYCMNLQEIGGFPPNIETFSAIRCTSLKDLDLTVLASNKKCFLRELIVDECEKLREIRGIPPSIVLLSARNCRSLTASCRGVLLNQELHETGNKRFCLPGSQIPQWFKHFSRGHSISFWFRNRFPAISICLGGPMHKLPIKLRPIVTINGTKMETEFQTEKVFHFEFPLLIDHILIFGIPHMKFNDNVDEVSAEDEWNHVVVSIDVDFKWDPKEPFVVQTGVHVIEQNSNIDDIRFTNPFSQQFVKGKHVSRLK